MQKLAEQALASRAEVVVVPDDAARRQFLDAWPAGPALPEIRVGAQALVDRPPTRCDAVMAAIVGAAGLPAALAAARAGKRVLLANKEALVAAGSLFMQAIRDSGAELLPIDSEHNAIFQCLPHGGGPRRRTRPPGVRRLLLTASGGPFRGRDLDDLHDVTPAQACAHPNWSMGRKISVDSATMLNKGLEVIEAHWLFAMPADRIEVVVHPQSVVHSMVEYHDGSILAQLGQPDMRTPIAYGLGFPERIDSGVGPLDLMRLVGWISSSPTWRAFPVWRWPLPRCERAGRLRGAERRQRSGGGGLPERPAGLYLDPRVIEAALEWQARRGFCYAQQSRGRAGAGCGGAPLRGQPGAGLRRPARLLQVQSPAYRSWILDPDAFHPARLCGCARLLIIFTSWATIGSRACAA